MQRACRHVLQLLLAVPDGREGLALVLRASQPLALNPNLACATVVATTGTSGGGSHATPACVMVDKVSEEATTRVASTEGTADTVARWHCRT
jgi:hypothetical protein